MRVSAQPSTPPSPRVFFVGGRLPRAWSSSVSVEIGKGERTTCSRSVEAEGQASQRAGRSLRKPNTCQTSMPRLQGIRERCQYRFDVPNDASGEQLEREDEVCMGL